MREKLSRMFERLDERIRELFAKTAAAADQSELETVVK
jgi:hypothetical protein